MTEDLYFSFLFLESSTRGHISFTCITRGTLSLRATGRTDKRPDWTSSKRGRKSQANNYGYGRKSSVSEWRSFARHPRNAGYLSNQNLQNGTPATATSAICNSWRFR